MWSNMWSGSFFDHLDLRGKCLHRRRIKGLRSRYFPARRRSILLPNIVRLFTFAAIPAIAMLRKSLRWFHRRLSGSGRRIRTLTYGVRVRCATITQSRYVLTNKNYYTHFSEFVNTFFTFFGIVLQTVPFAFFRAL